MQTLLQAELRDLPHLTTRLDEFGNLHAIYKYESSEREPFRLVAHMDHPAFVIHRYKGGEEICFAGRVDPKHFAGKSIVFHNEQTREPLGKAVVKSVTADEFQRAKLKGSIPAEATFAVWDLPKARCTKQLFISPACDDLVEVSVMLALLRRLALSGAKACVHALFTRAEEIGFAGALAALKAKEPLSSIPTLSLEASKARGFAKVGGGPIVRVGDRLSIFDSRVTHWLETAFSDLKTDKPTTAWQRLLMAGGSCEGSVFHRAGIPTGALCVALNNYHNMGFGKSVRSESISLRDWQGLYDFLFFLATGAKSLKATDALVAERFRQLEEKGLAALNH